MNQQFRILKQMIAMQRASFDGMLNTLILMWEQTGGVTERAVWLPEEGKKAFRQWVDVNKKGCEDLKNMIDGGYSNLENLLGKAAEREQQ